MATCEACGNDYDRTIRVEMNGRTHSFDCFECAIQKLAPTCGHCETRIIGHGVEADTDIFCCAHCAKAAGKSGLHDQVGTRTAA